jgi:hypothetical protein
VSNTRCPQRPHKPSLVGSPRSRSGSSEGRAPPRHGGGRRFDPGPEHRRAFGYGLGPCAFTAVKRVRVPYARPFPRSSTCSSGRLLTGRLEVRTLPRELAREAQLVWAAPLYGDGRGFDPRRGHERHPDDPSVEAAGRLRARPPVCHPLWSTTQAERWLLSRPSYRRTARFDTGACDHREHVSVPRHGRRRQVPSLDCSDAVAREEQVAGVSS